MKQIEILEIHNLGSNIAYCEAMGLARCFNAYANYCDSEDIMMIGFNENSGYTFISLENGVTLCSMLGNLVEYLITDFDTGKETFYESYFDAINSIAI